jgi:REP element-mobilizing transposase RayT
MQLTTIGIQVEKCWYEIPQHFPFVVLDEFVVMPNHIHGILIINKPTLTPISNTKNEFGPQSKNLASIVRGFKIGVTKYARSNNIDFGWQSRFNDHIIRNEASHGRIRNYIRNNPQNWDNDKFKH